MGHQRDTVGSDALHRLAAEQDQVLSRRQLIALGFSRHRLRDQLAARRWQRAGRKSVVVNTGPLSERQQWWVALFDSGPKAVLAGLTAAQASGLEGFRRRPIHVLVPDGGAGVPPPGVRLHSSRSPRPGDVHPLLRPPRTIMSRSLVDAALWEPRLRLGAAILAAGVQQRLARARDLRELTERATWSAARPFYLAVLGDIEGGAHALTELDFADICRRHHLPPPTRQGRRKDAQRRVRYLDAEWTPWRLAVEIDGAPHLDVLHAWADMTRQNEIVLATDLCVLRFPSVALRTDEGTVVDHVRRGLRLNGWRG
ncbi:hypothetical protein Sme01_01050 [Sphaerisporangium melleum]|uniref:DUF559 domain-containing protein n=1 Tax=Sphaerisporangium melleum TaxID=321316 RepID=A0A917VJU3_9ACTN|nr:hypothetical protein [Sphaerisporangium melleum]GGK88150.1 hypothetical protein GCM10007964_33380 [Sphaerisporangium melleum]GII67629.1 hypothetical protein Sme01_01050 [Sphaerisporangium melleum]